MSLDSYLGTKLLKGQKGNQDMVTNNTQRHYSIENKKTASVT